MTTISTTNTDLPVLNVPLLTEMVKWVGQDIAHLKEFYAAKGWPAHYQAQWVEVMSRGDVCNSRACVAGNAIIQSGEWMPDVLFVDYTAKPTSPNRHPYSNEYGSARRAIPIRFTDYYDSTGHRIYVEDTTRMPLAMGDAGERVLGLTTKERCALFDEDNSLADVVFVALTAAQARGVVLDLPEELVAEAQHTRYVYNGGWFDERDPEQF